MKSVNKVILLGLVGHDPEVKVTAIGIPVGRFSLTTNERFEDKSGLNFGPVALNRWAGQKLRSTCTVLRRRNTR
jgi:single-stranded DNA-binding protein